MEEQFLDETGLQKVAENVNSRLKTVTIMPVNPKDGQIVLYVGESGMAYTKGHVYQFPQRGVYDGQERCLCSPRA